VKKNIRGEREKERKARKGRGGSALRQEMTRAKTLRLIRTCNKDAAIAEEGEEGKVLRDESRRGNREKRRNHTN